MKTIIYIFLILWLSSCSYDRMDIVVDDSGYPREISKIILNKCATAGCHNDISYGTSANLNLMTWNKMFEGGSGGAAVIPYRPDFSTLLFFTNTDSAKGTVLQPTMPYNAPALSDEEYAVLKEWILNGAPDINGFVKFSDNPSRDKVYIANQGVDEVAVLDIKSSMIMRYISIGTQTMNEAPHMIKVSPDNQYWYAIFYTGTVLQKFRTSDNSHVADVSIGLGSWNTISISSDSKRAYITDMKFSGNIAVVDLENMSLIETWAGLDYVHGSVLNSTNDTLYVTAQTGNFIYKIPVNDHDNFERVLIDSTAVGWSTSALLQNPHEIAFNNDFSKYYITCQNSNDVRVMRKSDDKLLSIISTPLFPQEMSFSSLKPYLFVTCLSTINPGSTILGQVQVIDVNSDQLIKSINSGHQPHGIAVYDEGNKVYVSNRNASHGGPPSHHPTNTVGNGYTVAIDLNTLDLIPGYKTEVTTDPYSISIAR